MNTIYYPLQKNLFTDKYKKMSNDTKVLLAILTSRQNLSQKNADGSKWTNKDGNIFFKYSRENMSKIMNRSEKTIRCYIKELIDFNLLQEEILNNKSFNKSKALYLMCQSQESRNIEKNDSENLSTGLKASEIHGHGETTGSDTEKLPVRTRRNYRFGHGEITGSDTEKLPPRYTDLNNTNSKYIKVKSSHVMSVESIEDKLDNSINKLLINNELLLEQIEELKKENIKVKKDSNQYKENNNDTVELEEKQRKYLEIIKDNINYTNLNLNTFIDMNLVDEFVKIMISYLTEVKTNIITINKNEYSLESVKSRLLKLNENHFRHAYFRFTRVENTINNKSKYILSCLFSAYTESEAYMSNLYSSQFGALRNPYVVRPQEK